MQQSFDTSNVDRLVWAPEAVGSICFLISGRLAYLAGRIPRKMYATASSPVEGLVGR